MQTMKARQMIAEFVGTAILVMIGPGAAILHADKIGTLGVALAFGLALTVMAYSIGHISGCHINPAVTLAFLVTKKIGVGRAVNYWIAQLLGGIAGGAVIYALADLNGKTSFASNGWGKDGSPTGRGFGAMVIAEVVFTAVLVFVMLSTTNKSFQTGLGGIAVGATLAAIHLVTIPVDNTSVNPARSLGTAVFSNTNLPHLKQLWAFFVFPAIGAIVGALVWLATDEATLEGTMAASLVD